MLAREIRMLPRARERSAARASGGGGAMVSERGRGSRVPDLQEKIDFETRMQEGACKLLAASTQRDQVLHAAKSLLTCNARLIRYRAELQKHSEDQILAKVSRRSSKAETKEHMPCSGKIAISDIRIPLMWKDTDHFNDRGRSQRFAVFCLLKVESQIFETEMVIVDKALTDICFEDLIIFNDVKSNFELKLELYSCCMDEVSSITNTPKRLARKLSSSLTRSSRKKLLTALESGDHGSLLLTNPVAAGAKYHLLAETTLNLDDVETGFRTHSLAIIGNEEASFWLPLYGHVCSRLVAQPECMTKDMMAGYLNQQQNVGGLPNWTRLYCVLKRGYLTAYYSPEEIEAQMDPALNIAIDKETRIRTLEKDLKKRTCSFSLINPYSGETTSRVFAADSEGDLQLWMEAFWQHFCDLSQWKHCCKELMKIEIMSPRKPPLFLTKQATSVYHDMNIESPVKDEGLMDIIRGKIQETEGEFLLGHGEEAHPPRWASLFEGSHEVVFQKSRLSPHGPSPLTPTSPGRAKKRPAPPPPAGKQPYRLRNSDPDQTRKTPPSSGSESKLRRPPPLPPLLSELHSAIPGEDVVQATATLPPARPVPIPRQKSSLGAKLDPRTRIPSEV
ncbi:rhotekin-2 isoform X1 [Amblyraja radiata]|uniref:rhotekin-2 isoform X1 n=1 Tax=Amblyraja radiata TaxID=386614 RepID=UPI0014022B5A|nr:rhotekin-2 isoform X1 [Amblyraja radiata]